MVNLGSSRPPGPGERGAGRPGRWFDDIAASPRPAVVDYAADGRRVELSGRVLANWAAKTANLLEVEGQGPGARVLVDLPLDWMSLALALGLARSGVEVAWADPGEGTRPPAVEPADLVVSGAPGDWAGHPAELWAVDSGTPEAGGPGGSAPLPPHALDFAAEVRLQADQCPLPLPGPDLAAVVAGWTEPEAPGAGLDAGTSRTRLSPRERGLVVAADGARLDGTLMRAVAGTWAAGHAVVLVSVATAAELVGTGRSGEAGAVARLVAAEQLGQPLST
jgi:uncharacterized protein (TIGR03089 family)